MFVEKLSPAQSRKTRLRVIDMCLVLAAAGCAKRPIAPPSADTARQQLNLLPASRAEIAAVHTLNVSPATADLDRALA
jgi:hypothetical protein